MYEPLANVDDVNSTKASPPTHISTTFTEFVPDIFGKILIENESVIVPEAILVEQLVEELATDVILIVVFPELARAEAGIVNVPTPDVNVTDEAVCEPVLAPDNV